MSIFNLKRARLLKQGKETRGPVLYWMSRDQRVKDNWALLFAAQLARESRTPLGVVFCLVPQFLGATLRQYTFMIRGLEEVEQSLSAHKISFQLVMGNPTAEIPRCVSEQKAGALVTDFDPLRIKRQWKRSVARQIDIPFWEVDAHNIVPCWLASPKQEYGAYTLRPKIQRALSEFLQPFPPLRYQPENGRLAAQKPDWRAALKKLKIDSGVSPVNWLRPGESAALDTLRHFLRAKLARYGEVRNDPTQDGQSNLSPYLHFGQLSAQRVAWEVRASQANASSQDEFLEELIIRRELSDNFCFYCEGYNSFEAFPGWAKHTLNKHRKDRRPYTYSYEQFEQAKTHDDLWNAAQLEMVHRGKMHGYLRMYWGKKILEWSESPEHALDIAIRLNDRYELDGRDPNGYAGIAWSIGGVHDRPWPERPIFGKIRYMSHNGCRSKFDVEEYVERIRRLV